MNLKNKHIIIIVASFISIGLLIFFSWLYADKKNLNWRESYRSNDTQPYGAFVIAELIKDYYKDFDFKVIDQPLYKVLKKPGKDPKANYVFIGKTLSLSERSADSLMSFVDDGNNAFIIASYLPDALRANLFEKLYTDIKSYYNNYDSIVSLDFYHPKLSSLFHAKYYYPESDYQFEKTYDWKYLIEETEDYDFYIPLGKMQDDLIVFFKIPYGEGNFYFHTLPMAFTNYTLKNDGGLEYAQKVFTHMKKGDIYWDMYSKTFTYSSNNNQSNKSKFSDSPISFIMSQPSLKWAWLLAMVLIVIYVLFKAKRKQKVIPVVDPYNNTSLEYVQTIGKLYFQQQDHKKLGIQKMKLFLADLRSKYHIHTNHINEELIKLISAKSQVPIDEVEKIFNKYETIEKFYKIEETDLEHFYLSIENFYKKCK